MDEVATRLVASVPEDVATAMFGACAARCGASSSTGACIRVATSELFARIALTRGQLALTKIGPRDAGASELRVTVRDVE
ncbi:MAG: hypothetical protein ABI467_13085 [Kofleriaceae bacterium]